jgi:hypothetical protein
LFISAVVRYSIDTAARGERLPHFALSGRLAAKGTIFMDAAPDLKILEQQILDQQTLHRTSGSVPRNSQTKIVATVGPACDGEEKLAELIAACTQGAE